MATTRSNTLKGVTVLVKQVSELINASRQLVLKQTNTIIVLTYFNIGRIIVQHEQQGKNKAEYGKATIIRLSAKLTAKFGTGFAERNIEQMRMYVNYYDRYVKENNENPTIGIIICKDKSDAIVEITLPKEQKQIFASRYKLYLPSKAELKKLVK